MKNLDAKTIDDALDHARQTLLDVKVGALPGSEVYRLASTMQLLVDMIEHAVRRAHDHASGR